MPTTALLKSVSDAPSTSARGASIDIAVGEAVDFHNSLMGRTRTGSGTLARKTSASNVLLVGNVQSNDLFNTDAHPMSPDRAPGVELPPTDMATPRRSKDCEPLFFLCAVLSTLTCHL